LAVIGVSASLEYEDSSAFVPVAGVKSVNFPGFNVSSVDTTHLGNTNFAMSFMPGMVDAGALTFECEFSEATYTALQGKIRETIGWRVTGPDDEDVAVTCDGFLTKLDVQVTPADELMISGEVKLTGMPVVS
jgi:hypothetical protein